MATGYEGSCIVFYQQAVGDAKYLLDMNEALKTGNFVAVKIEDSEEHSMLYVEDLAFDDHMVRCLVMDDKYGHQYIVSRDGTVEKYIPPVVPEENETNNQQQTVTDFQGGVYNYIDEAGNTSEISLYTEHNKYTYTLYNSNGNELVQWPINGEFIYDSDNNEVTLLFMDIYYNTGELFLERADFGATFKINDNKLELISKTSTPTINGKLLELFPEIGVIYTKGPR